MSANHNPSANGEAEQIRFSDLVEVNPPVDCSRLDANDEVSFIPMSDVTDNGQWAIRQTRSYCEVQSGYSVFAEGDVLFAKITPCTENGKGCHAVNLKNGVGFGSTEFHILRAKEGVNSRLVYHLSAARDVRAQATAVMGGSAGQQRVPSDFFKLLRVSRRCLAQQDKYADLFDATEATIERTRAVIVQTRKLKTALLDDMFINGLPGQHQKFVTTPPIGRIPADWRVVRLDEIAKVERGKFTHRPRNDPRFYGGDIPFVQTSDVVNSGDYLREYSQTLNERGLSVSRRFPPNTILFVIAGSVGETTIASYEVAFPDSVVGITPHEGIDPLFLLRVLQHARPRILRSATESAQANISLELLEPLPFPLPGDAERDAIMQTIRAVETRIERESARLEQLNGTKAALSQALLTGRVPVPAKGSE